MTHYTYSNTGICFRNVYRFADIEDVLENPQAAKAFFQDLLVNRPTEFSALIRLYIIASHSLDLNRVALTSRQGEAIKLAREAMQHNVHPTRYVASKLHVSPRAVQKLFARASQRYETNMFAFEPKDHIDIRSTKWYPSKSEISQQIAKTSHECAACGREVHSGRFILCRECFERFGTHENWQNPPKGGGKAPASWLLPESRRIGRLVRKEAINELFRAHGFSGQDFEEALENYQFQQAS